LYEDALTDGPVACRTLGDRIRSLHVGPNVAARAREALGVETFRGEDGRPYYRLPAT
jgi:hypothetical protein